MLDAGCWGGRGRKGRWGGGEVCACSDFGAVLRGGCAQGGLGSEGWVVVVVSSSGLVAGALLVFAGTALVNLPATLVWRWLAPADGAWVAVDLRGTLWQGQATRLRWNGNELGRLDWRLQPAALWRGHLALQLQLRGPITASARWQRGPGGEEWRDLQARLPAHWLGGLLASPPLQPPGQVRVDVPVLRRRGDRLQALSGRLSWREAALSGPASAALGTLHADFALAADGRVHGTIRDDGGALAANGRFVADLAHYRAEVRLSARDARIAPALAWLGQARGDGRWLVLEGASLAGPPVRP